jgi:hypothetical protein
MKKALLLILLLLSINAFAQNKFSKSRHQSVTFKSIKDVSGSIKDEGLRTSNVYSENNSEQTGSNQKRMQRSVIQVNDSIYKWKLDTSSLAWYIYSKHINAFDANGNQISNIIQYWNDSNLVWENNTKYIWTFDANSNQTSRISQNWNDSSLVWVNSYYWTQAFDINNFKTVYIGRNWDDSLLSWVNSFRESYTYDANNNLTVDSLQNWNGNSWRNSSIYILTYDASNNLICKIHQGLNTGIPINQTKKTYTYDVNNNQIGEQWESWVNDSIWRNSCLYAWTYDASNNQTGLIEQNWYVAGNIWYNSYKDSLIYDASNNLVIMLHKHWNGVDSTWDNSTQENSSYDVSNNKISIFKQNWNGTTWVNNRQSDYTYDVSNFMKSSSVKGWNSTGTAYTSGDSAYYYYNTEAVWPGDANNDSIVDNNDLLPIGLYYGTSGIARDSISNLWMGQLCAQWPAMQADSTNMKHADSNGDGIVNSSDTVAINLNYGLTVGSKKKIIHNEKSVTSLSIVPSASFFYGGDTARFDVIVGDVLNPVNALYGIAYDIHVDPVFIESGTMKFEHTSSWLGNPFSDALSVAKIFESPGNIENAIVRTDHADQTGYGKIGEFEFVIEPSVAYIDTLHILISYYNAVDATGQPVSFTVIDTAVVIFPVTTSILQNALSDVSFYPNPVNSTLHMRLQQNSKIEILDIKGLLITTINDCGKEVTIDVGNLSSGVYIIKAESDKDIFINKFIKE